MPLCVDVRCVLNVLKADCCVLTPGFNEPTSFPHLYQFMCPVPYLRDSVWPLDFVVYLGVMYLWPALSLVCVCGWGWVGGCVHLRLLYFPVSTLLKHQIQLWIYAYFTFSIQLATLYSVTLQMVILYFLLYCYKSLCRSKFYKENFRSSYKMMHCSIQKYPTVCKVVKMSSTSTSYNIKLLLNMNVSVVIIQ